jgi:GH35 family endo-1,4-beta-xylanase
MRLLGTRAGSSPAPAIVLVVAVAAGCAGGFSSLAPGTAPGSAASPSPALRDLAGSRQIGTAVGLPQLKTDTGHTEILARDFNSVTPDNAMKWGPVEPARGTFDWSGADDIVAFAQAHGQKVRSHTLVWHSQLPGWPSNGAFTGAQLGEILKNHIATEVGRYAGKIHAWDVVNEPFVDDGTRRDTIWLRGPGQTYVADGTRRDTIWLRGPGQDYVADAFRWAHAADPAAKLYLNDYDIEGINTKSDAMCEPVKSLRLRACRSTAWDSRLTTTWPSLSRVTSPATSNASPTWASRSPSPSWMPASSSPSPHPLWRSKRPTTGRPLRRAWPFRPASE